MDSFFKKIKTKKGKLIVVCLLLFLIYWFSLPNPLFRSPTSTVINDAKGNLLGALIADDGQWRFPYDENVPDKFRQSIIQFEDRAFTYHMGVNLFSIGRALIQNIKSGRKVSGGSTLTMQVIRLSRQGKSRTVLEKIIEIILATRLELTYSKKEIMALYASNAPFGGNVVGLEAASWRYFGRKTSELSWAESAMLAVLPNAPSLIYPGKNHELLFQKRNRLLERLQEVNIIDKQTCELAKQEPLPKKPFPLPKTAPHLLARVSQEGWKGKVITSTLSKKLQERLNNIIERHYHAFKGNEIFNAAALVVDVKTGNALAYVGNTNDTQHSNDVDVVTASRSTGSILKPFLFSFMLSDGDILPGTLVADIPTQIAGYVPQNYNLSYDGAVPAKRALARSLNIPAVRMLQEYGIEKFNINLKKLGMNTLNFSPDHYGLTAILGGAEGSLWNIAGMYASMARTLNYYSNNSSTYLQENIHAPVYVLSEKEKVKAEPTNQFFLDAASIKLTFDAMVEVSRPDEEGAWKEFSSSYPIAWKTGTSFGFRDAWAIGVTPSYVIAAWVGNASGEGRPGLTGISMAAPILFDIFSAIRKREWFEQPYDEMEKVAICSQSGHRASTICTPIDSVYIPRAGLKTPPCNYHRIIHLDKTKTYRVNSDCESTENMIHIPWFVLPPSQEWYYKSKNSTYREMPPFKAGCASSSYAMEIIYPKDAARIYVPLELDGSVGKTVFKVAHRKPQATIYWHLDEKYIGSTSGIHEFGLNPPYGKHILTLVDEEGETLQQVFEIIRK